MAHAYFSEINSEGIVLKTVVADENDVLANGGNGSEQAANHFKSIAPLSVNGVKWVQTFKDGTRGVYAGTGDIYNEEHDVFCETQIYASWTLNTTTGKYEAPVAQPTPPTNGHLSWDEDNQQWKSTKYIPDDLTEDNDTMLDPPEVKIWNPSNSSWE